MDNTEASALQKAIQIAGSATALANEIGITKGAISQWKRVPAEHCPAIERITAGEVRCEQLRPDIDWSVLRNSDFGPKFGRRSTDKTG